MLSLPALLLPSRCCRSWFLLLLLPWMTQASISWMDETAPFPTLDEEDDLLSSSSSLTPSSPLQAFQDWFFKTRMSFYGHDLQLPWWMGLLCWSFTAAGLIMVWTEPSWVSRPIVQLPIPTTNGTRQPPGHYNAPATISDTSVVQIYYPYRMVAWLILVIQSPLSFMADYVHMTNDSYWHVADRCFALPLMTMEVLKLVLMCRESWRGYMENKTNPNAAMPLWLCMMYVAATAFAVFSFVQSTLAQDRLKRDEFVVWHNLWHAYPLVASSIVLFDFYACQGWKRSTRQYLYAVELHLMKKVD